MKRYRTQIQSKEKHAMTMVKSLYNLHFWILHFLFHFNGPKIIFFFLHTFIFSLAFASFMPYIYISMYICNLSLKKSYNTMSSSSIKTSMAVYINKFNSTHKKREILSTHAYTFCPILKTSSPTNHHL